ncbi:MAG: DNA alkylation repair protein [Prevotella sp.]
MDNNACTDALQIMDAMLRMRNEEQSRVLARFFKTEKGQYGEGDRFLGIKVPQTRMVVKQVAQPVALNEIDKLLDCEWHEVRLCGLLLLVRMMQQAVPGKWDTSIVTLQKMALRRQELAQFYLHHAERANNWDLVDLSAPYILGIWMLHPGPDGLPVARDVLERLASSPCLWEQRIAIVSTLMLIRHRQFDETLSVARLLLHHPHDLIQKAVGWMLREVGKRDIALLRDFLQEYSAVMPRTALRYAIEKMGPAERKHWMNRRKT